MGDWCLQSAASSLEGGSIGTSAPLGRIGQISVILRGDDAAGEYAAIVWQTPCRRIIYTNAAAYDDPCA